MPTAVPLDYQVSKDATGGPPTGYNPTEAEQSTINMVEKLFSASRKALQDRHLKWIGNYKFFKGKQWPERRPTYRHSEVLNYIFSEVQTVLVLLTDNRPNIEITPDEPSDLEFAEILSQILKSKWDKNSWAQILAEAIVDASIYDAAIASVPWKPELMSGLGDFDFETEDPFHVFPDPEVQSKVNDDHCGYFIIAKPKNVRKLKAKYPEYADFLKADLGDLSGLSVAKEDTDEIKYRSPTDNRVLVESQNSVRPGLDGQVLEITCYMKSDELIEEECGEKVDETTGIKTKLYQTKKKYPNGRKIVIANGVLLENDKNPYEGGKFPFARLVDHALPREFWGMGEVENLKSPQMIVNKLISYILDVLTLMGNPIWVVDTTAGFETDNLTNQPGLVVEKNPGSEVRREEGVQLQPYVMQVLEFMSNNVLAKLGSTSEVSKGAAPPDASGYAIAQLQEAAQTRIRGKSRNVEIFLKEVGDLMVDRMLQFYKLPRVERITNNQNAAEYFKFHISDVEDEAGNIQKTATIQPIFETKDPLTGEGTGQYAEGTPMQVPIKSKLDVRINVGSTLPFAKAENRILAEKLFDKGLIDAEEYLTQIDYPNREKIIQRLKAMPPPPPQGAPNAGPIAPPGPAAA